MAEWKALGAVFYCLISLAFSISFVAGVLMLSAWTLRLKVWDWTF